MDDLLPLTHETTFVKCTKLIKNFSINVGIFKTFAFLIVLRMIVIAGELVPTLNNALLQHTLTIGEFVSSVLVVCGIILMCGLYGCWYLDTLIKWGLE